MKVIKEYRLKKGIFTPQTLYITKGAEIAAVADEYDFLLFALCDYQESDTELRTFQLFSTFGSIYEDNVRYIGYGGENIHIIELLG